MKFPCTSCGACCRRVHLVPGWPKEYLKEDGSCIHLDNNLCSIYEFRPPICRIGFSLASSGLTELQYKIKTAEICNTLMKEDGIVDKFIPLTLFETEEYGI
jgi:Fe-S-cluster containining protein